MEELVKSSLRLTWAMSLFGVRQIGSMFTDSQDAGRSLAAVIQAVESRLAPPRTAAEGWHWITIEEWIGTGPAASIWRGARRELLAAAGEAVATCRVVMPESEARWAVRELENKLTAFAYFENGGEVLGGSALEERVAEVLRHASYPALWMLEGLGFDAARQSHQSRQGHQNREGRLRALQAPELPLSSLIPLHAGWGLCLSRHHLSTARRPDGAGLEDFLARCDDDTRAGYQDVAFEPLGFASRLLNPRAVEGIGSRLSELAPERVATFWHGVGRGLYFALPQLLAGVDRTWAAVVRARREPPHEVGRSNALAGLAWAFALVNFRRPQIVEHFLARHAQRLTAAEKAAFANGVASVSLLWYDAMSDDPIYDAFCRRSSRAASWERLVRAPCRRALQRYPEIVRREGLGSLFRYEPRSEDREPPGTDR